MGRKGVPERWECYSPIGQQIPNTPFIAFKVPLNEGLLRRFQASVKAKGISPPESTNPLVLPNQPDAGPSKPFFANDWGLKDLHDQCPNLTHIIDLTNTSRYYNVAQLKAACPSVLQHVKIATEGHVVPKAQVVRKFFDIVDAAVAGSADALIGVHCTHGVNRTGYLICRYLIQKLNWNPNDAIQAFGLARGHNLERDNYLQNLIKNHPLLGRSSSERQKVDPKVTELGRFGKNEQEHQINPRHYDQPSDAEHLNNGYNNSNWRDAQEPPQQLQEQPNPQGQYYFQNPTYYQDPTYYQAQAYYPAQAYYQAQAYHQDWTYHHGQYYPQEQHHGSWTTPRAPRLARGSDYFRGPDDISRRPYPSNIADDSVPPDYSRDFSRESDHSRQPYLSRGPDSTRESDNSQRPYLPRSRDFSTEFNSSQRPDLPRDPDFAREDDGSRRPYSPREPDFSRRSARWKGSGFPKKTSKRSSNNSKRPHGSKWWEN